MNKGHVKWYNRQKGYGFIGQEGSPEVDIFVHYSALEGVKLKTGDLVEYEIGEAEKGTVAVNVTVTGQMSEEDIAAMLEQHADSV